MCITITYVNTYILYRVHTQSLPVLPMHYLHIVVYGWANSTIDVRVVCHAQSTPTRSLGTQTFTKDGIGRMTNSLLSITGLSCHTQSYLDSQREQTE